MSQAALEAAVQQVESLMDRVASNKTFSREQYRQYLRDIASSIEVRLEALATDDAQEAESDDE